MMKDKLLIWDFDGVISDSEHLWVKNWTDTLKRLKNIDLSLKQQKYYLEGKADKTKVELLATDFPELRFDTPFWNAIKQNETDLIAAELRLTDGVLDILEDGSFAQCVATGANPDKHFQKVKKLRLEKYFTPENTFTAYLVEKGKPAPDIFLYAAEKMGFAPADCLVLEDSLAGITAAKAAGIPVIAYTGATGNNKTAYREECKKTGAFAVSSNMTEIHGLIRKHFFQT